jgi:putative aldouronate transport system permease protein
MVNTTLVIFIALFAGYALQNKNFRRIKQFTLYILIPMYFSGGLVPTYMLVNSWLGWRDSYLALILSVVTSPFLIIIFRNNIANLPKEMSESAEIDGANDIIILLKVLLPLIIPTVMAFVIFNAVGYWNEWFNCMLYIQTPTKYTMQYKLRQILATSTIDFNSLKGLAISIKDLVHPQNIKMAALLVTIIPIMLIYPFLQKYFIHGVIVGALKE